MNTKTKPPENPPAFPCELGEESYGSAKRTILPNGDTSWLMLSTGMTLRDYFAAATLNGLLSKESETFKSTMVQTAKSKNIPVECVYAQVAYTTADAMLAFRSETSVH